MTELVPIPDRGHLKQQFEQYGTAVSGQPLLFCRALEQTDVLLFAGIHGEEPETTALLSKALRSLAEAPKRCSVILAANPDGILRGLRGNANGVELNRNFPASNWSADPIYHQWTLSRPYEVALSPGKSSGSEPEVQALIKLIGSLNPSIVVSMHGPLGCIDDPLNTPLAQWLASRTGLKVVPDCGYSTPGSFGSWAADKKLPVITYELPAISVWEMLDSHLTALQDLLARGLEVIPSGS